MSQNSRIIAQLIREIAEGAADLRFPVMSGTVVAGSTDTDNMVCTVLLSVSDDSAETSGIMLNAVTLNSNGLILYPADGSNVWVAEVDGPGKWGIVKCSDLVKMAVTIGQTTFVITDGQVQAADGSGGQLTMTGGKLQFKNNSGSLFNMLSTHIQNLQTHITNIDALTVDTAVGPSGVPENIAEFALDYSNMGQDLNALGEILD